MHVASRFVNTNTSPPDAGRALAEALLRRECLGEDVKLNLPPAMLIACFFGGFLQHVADTEPSLLEVARKTLWVPEFEFQRENITRWMADFKPVV
jgi:hypothetical protein